MSQPALTTNEIKQRLADRYAPDEWATVFEVADKTGGATRICDCLAFNLWESRGYAVHGFEIKASRGDWLRELKQPEKADAFFNRCNYWWLVVGNPSIIKRGELPAGWGLLVPAGNRLKIAQRPARHRAAAVTSGFLAALMRLVNKPGTPEVEINGRIEAAYKAGRTYEMNKADAERRALRLEMGVLKQRVTEFERETGVKISQRSAAPEMVATAKALASVLTPARQAELETLANQLKTVADNLANVQTGFS